MSDKFKEMLLYKSYSGVYKSFCDYYRLYGGIKSLLCSPYLHFSVIFSIIIFPYWKDGPDSMTWFDVCLSVIPNLLGFTLGGYAILLAFGNERFLNTIAGPHDSDKKSGKNCEAIQIPSNSLYMEINANFVHFLIMQFLALIAGIVSKAINLTDGLLAGAGFAIFIYSITTGLGAIFSILTLAGWFDHFVGRIKDDNQNRKHN